MDRLTEITPRFVEFIPAQIEHGILYVSFRFCCAIHLCACGCGKKTVTPIKTSEVNSQHFWRYTENDKKVTLDPSIGNFSGESPYHAHYFIRDNKIIWV